MKKGRGALGGGGGLFWWIGWIIGWINSVLGILITLGLAVGGLGALLYLKQDSF